MQSHHHEPPHIVQCEWCSNALGASTPAAYHTALEFQASPDVLAEKQQHENTARVAVNDAQQRRHPGEPEPSPGRHHHRHHKHHHPKHHRRLSSAADPRAKAIPQLVLVPSMPKIEPHFSSHPAEMAVPHLAAPVAQECGRGPVAAAGRSGASTCSSMSKVSNAPSVWHSDHNAATCLEMCLAFVVLVLVGVVLLFILFRSGMWPFHGGAITTARIETVFNGRDFSKTLVPIFHHASTGGVFVGTEDADSFSATGLLADAVRRAAGEAFDKNSTNYTVTMFGNARFSHTFTSSH
ncbi:uncharacterized protein LOC142574886 [Dermacentor variabilis]|uniref:uncharacterized protein LOC142574886 n=1 Tax=Dermacentor variabilis TaxID=34621 RepID=UPI003F5AFB51